MAQIFISHSQYDEDIRKYFDEVFAGTTVRAVRLEFERYKNPPSKFVLKQIGKSDAIFVLLGPKITLKPATQSWVGFETGVAAGMREPCPIWVFEPTQYAPVPFPVPFLHHYVLYDMGSQEDREYIKSIVAGHRFASIIPVTKSILAPRGRRVTCPHEGCGMSYNLHTPIDEIHCPTCRQKITFGR